MCIASRAVPPSAPVLVKRSEPARSTRLSLLAHATPSAPQQPIINIHFVRASGAACACSACLLSCNVSECKPKQKATACTYKCNCHSVLHRAEMRWCGITSSAPRSTVSTHRVNTVCEREERAFRPWPATARAACPCAHPSMTCFGCCTRMLRLCNGGTSGLEGRGQRARRPWQEYDVCLKAGWLPKQQLLLRAILQSLHAQ